MFRYYKFVIFMSLILALSCSTENNIEVPPTEIPVQGEPFGERGCREDRRVSRRY